MNGYLVPQLATSILINSAFRSRDGACIGQGGTSSFRYVLACADNAGVGDGTANIIGGGHAYRAGITNSLNIAIIGDTCIGCSHGNGASITRNGSIRDRCAGGHGNACTSADGFGVGDGASRTVRGAHAYRAIIANSLNCTVIGDAIIGCGHGHGTSISRNSVVGDAGSGGQGNVAACTANDEAAIAVVNGCSAVMVMPLPAVTFALFVIAPAELSLAVRFTVLEVPRA